MAQKKSIKEAMQTSETIRMFKSDFLERLSHVHPATPFVVYIPIVLACLYISYAMHGNSIATIALYFLIGVATWSITEYILHRFVFHIPQTNKFNKMVYFYIHGIHHDAPNDATRLVMPPLASIPLAVGFYFIARALFDEPYLAWYSGFVSGYLYYDWLHFATHFYHFDNAYFKKIKKAHMIHHYVASNANFGFTTPTWDYVFGTRYKKEVKESADQMKETGIPQ